MLSSIGYLIKCNFILSDSSVTVIVGGGYPSFFDTVEVMGKSSHGCIVSTLPYGISAYPSIAYHNEFLILCGGSPPNDKKCLKYENGTWSHFNDLLQRRSHAPHLVMGDSIFIFGGPQSPWSSEYLKQGSTVWQEGPNIPTQFDGGCAVKINNKELLLIGGVATEDRILKLDTDGNTWTTLDIKLLKDRWVHRCMRFNNKIVITGKYVTRESTEIIDIDSNGKMKIRKGPDMNVGRSDHGMDVVLLDGKPALVVFGGYTHGGSYLKSVEVWRDEDETWELLDDLELERKNGDFGFTTLPKKFVCQ